MRPERDEPLDDLINAVRGQRPTNVDQWQQFEARLAELAATTTAATSCQSSTETSVSAPATNSSTIALIGKPPVLLSSLALVAASAVGLLAYTDSGSTGTVQHAAALQVSAKPPVEAASTAAAHEPRSANLDIQVSAAQTIETSVPTTPAARANAADGKRTPEPATPRAVAVRTDHATTSHAKPDRDSPILREIRALAPARDAIRAGDPRRALQVLDSVEVTHLANHAVALRAIALCDSGQRRAGRQLAKRLGAAATPSAFADKVLEACGRD